MSRLSEYSKFDHVDEEEEEEEGGTIVPSSAAGAGVSTTATNTSLPQRVMQNKGLPAPEPEECIQRIPDTSQPIRFWYIWHGQRVYEWYQTLDVVVLRVPLPPEVAQKHKELECQIKARHVMVRLRPSNSNSSSSSSSSSYFFNHTTCGLVDVEASTWFLEDDDEGPARTGVKKWLVMDLYKAQKGLVWEYALSLHHPPPLSAPAHSLPLAMSSNDPTTATTAFAPAALGGVFVTGPSTISAGTTIAATATPPPAAAHLSTTTTTTTTSATANSTTTQLNILDLQDVQRELLLERFQQEHSGMDFRDARIQGSVPDPRTFMGGISYN